MNEDRFAVVATDETWSVMSNMEVVQFLEGSVSIDTGMSGGQRVGGPLYCNDLIGLQNITEGSVPIDPKARHGGHCVL